MKAGIVTFHCANNYGAVLQVYALSKIIEETGVQVEIIDFTPERLIKDYRIFFNIREELAEVGIIKTSWRTLLRIRNSKKKLIKKINFEHFRKNYLSVSSVNYKNSNDLLMNPPQYDYYITGSDQVWNPEFFESVGKSYFLDFAPKDKVKISYSASIASDASSEQFIPYKMDIKSINHISVREKTAKILLEDLIDNNIQVTLDPTLLWDDSKWKAIETYDFKLDNFIIVYDIVKSDELVSIANRIAKELDCDIISFSSCDGYINWKGSFDGYKPTDFLGLFRKARFIVTSSFHGTAFSIVYQKPFYTVINSNKGSRMTDLLNELDLGDRILISEDELQIVDTKIDYSKATERLNLMRYNSVNFIKKAIFEVGKKYED